MLVWHRHPQPGRLLFLCLLTGWTLSPAPGVERQCPWTTLPSWEGGCVCSQPPPGDVHFGIMSWGHLSLKLQQGFSLHLTLRGFVRSARCPLRLSRPQQSLPPPGDWEAPCCFPSVAP